MKFKQSFSDELRFGTASALIAAMGLIAAPAAVAQDAEDDEEEIVLEEVIVTGSRIKRSSYDTSAPVITLGRQQLADRNFVNVGDLLSEVPAFGAPGASPNNQQGGFAIGQNVVDFLGLGEARTLTVVNGRRFITSSIPVPGGSSTAQGLQVDLNVIPASLIESVDTILLDGAPTYGSDAIAGTINVRLRNDFEGLEISGQYGVSNEGDGENYQIQGIIGGNFADGRGNAVLSFEYNEQQGLFGRDRPFFRTNNPFTVRNPTTGETRVQNGDRSGRGFIVSGVGDFGAISINSGLFLPVAGAGADADGNFFEFDENGNVIPFIAGPGIEGQSPFFANGGSGSDLFDDVEQILTPSTRINVAGLASYKINDYVTAFAEYIFSNQRAEELSQQDDVFSDGFGGDQGAPLFSINNPFLNDQARAALQAAGATTFGVSRFAGPIVGGGANFNESFTWRIVGGLQGDFELSGIDFDWEVSGNVGQFDLETRNVTILTDNVINALNVRALTQEDIDTGNIPAFSPFGVRNNQTVDLNIVGAQVGDIVCAGEERTPLGFGGLVNDVDRAIEGCVPLNFFGNQATPEASDFVTGLEITSSDVEQRVFEAFLSTSNLFTLPGGDVGASVSYMNRREEAAFTPDGLSELALGQGDPSVPGGGSFTTNEVGIEFDIPILDDEMVPFVNGFTISPKVRWVDNSIAGADFTYHLGGRFTVFDYFSFRGGYTRSIRAPGLGELFDPQLATRGFVTDPCDTRFVDAGPEADAPDAARRINCESIGINTADFTSIAVNLSRFGQSGGNPGLTNEQSDSYSIGVVIQPYDIIPGLDISADYFNINIADRITNVTATVAAQACFDADPSQFPEPICDAIQRDSEGQIVFFQTGFQNAAASLFEAVQINTRYQFQVADALSLFGDDYSKEDFGQLTFNINGIRRITDIFQATSGNLRINNVGQNTREEFSGTFDVAYDYQDFRLFWRMLYTSGLDLDVQDRDNFIFFNEDDEVIDSIGDRWVHNLTLTYAFSESIQLSASVDNVFNRRGDVTERAHFDFNQTARGFAELFGRSFTFAARMRF